METATYPEPRAGALAATLAARTRRFKVWQIDGLFGLPTGPQHIAIVLPNVGEDEDIVLRAHARVASAAKKAEGGEALAQKDPALNINAQAIEALWRACRDVNPDGTPSKFYAFVGDNEHAGADWMRANLDKHEIHALYNLYMATDAAFSARGMMEEGTIDLLVPLLADNLGNTVSDLALAHYGRQDIIDMCVVLASRLREARLATESLITDRDEAEEQLRLARMTDAALHEALAQAKARAERDEPLEARLELEMIRRGLLGVSNDAEEPAGAG